MPGGIAHVASLFGFEGGRFENVAVRCESVATRGALAFRRNENRAGLIELRNARCANRAHGHEDEAVGFVIGGERCEKRTGGCFFEDVRCEDADGRQEDVPAHVVNEADRHERRAGRCAKRPARSVSREGRFEDVDVLGEERAALGSRWAVRSQAPDGRIVLRDALSLVDYVRAPVRGGGCKATSRPATRSEPLSHVPG